MGIYLPDTPPFYVNSMVPEASLNHLIRKGVRNPDVAARFLKTKATEKANNISNTYLNVKKRLGQRKKESPYGLVLNWGLHKRGQWTVAEYPYFVEQFIDRFDPVIITSQNEYDQRCESLDYIFAFGSRNNKGPTLSYCQGCNHTVVLFASDPHNKSEWLQQYIVSNDIDYTVSPCYHSFLYHLPDFDEDRLVHFPWAVPAKFVMEPDEIEYRGAKNIHLFGATGDDIYEFRDWIRTHRFVKEYTTSGHQNKVFNSEDFYLWLRNFDALVAAGSLSEQWQYVFAKYYEIPAAGALLFAQDCEDLREVGFTEDNAVIFSSKGEFRSKAEDYLEHPRDYLDRRRNGANLISSQHTIEDRIDSIESLFEERV